MIRLLCVMVMVTPFSLGQMTMSNNSLSTTSNEALKKFTKTLKKLGEEAINMFSERCTIESQYSNNCIYKTCRFATELVVNGEKGNFTLKMGNKQYSVLYSRNASASQASSCRDLHPTAPCDCKRLTWLANACRPTTTSQSVASKRTDCQQEVVHVLGYIVLGLVVGILISTGIFCIILRRLRSAQQLPNKGPKSDNEDNRLNNVVHSALYNEFSEPNQTPAMPRGQSVKEADVVDAKNYEPPLSLSTKDHLYNTIENESTSTCTGAVHFTTHHKDTDATQSENVYNHLNENYDRAKTTDNYDHVPYKNEEDDYHVSERNPKTDKTTQLLPEQNGNYFTLEKQHAMNKGNVTEMQNNNSTSDDYFVIKKHETALDLKL